MAVYLVRHGKAEQGPEDDIRALTEKGMKTVGRVAKRLARADVHVDQIEHSGLVRARQTAEILARELGAPVLAVAGLRPEDDVTLVGNQLNGRLQSVMLVGHNPFMERLAAYLLTGSPDGASLRFRTSSAACLVQMDSSWTLEWLLDPDLA